jgi:hypothetical protein
MDETSSSQTSGWSGTSNWGDYPGRTPSLFGDRHAHGQQSMSQNSYLTGQGAPMYDPSQRPRDWASSQLSRFSRDVSGHSAPSETTAPYFSANVRDAPTSLIYQMAKADVSNSHSSHTPRDRSAIADRSTANSSLTSVNRAVFTPSERDNAERASSSQTHQSSVYSDKTHRAIEPYIGPRNFQSVIGAIGSAGLSWHPSICGAKQFSQEPMVRCSDGRIRRFPPSHGPSKKYNEQLRDGMIYDSPSHLVTQRIGSIEPSEDLTQASFVVSDYSISPITVGPYAAYPLPSGQFMVPQMTFLDCTNACELMMLLDHGDVSVDDKYVPNSSDMRRRLHNLSDTLQSRTGRTSHITKHSINYNDGLFSRHPSRKETWRDISSKIDQMGSCILAKGDGGGHVIMLDKVLEEKGKFYLTVREPFHGSNLEIKDSPEFFRDEFEAKKSLTFRTLFLERSQNQGDSVA